MQRRSSHLRNVSAGLGARIAAQAPITEPSGVGPFAEAMRELIADLSPVPVATQLTQAQPANLAPVRGARPRHLYLVR